MCARSRQQSNRTPLPISVVVTTMMMMVMVAMVGYVTGQSITTRHDPESQPACLPACIILPTTSVLRDGQQARRLPLRRLTVCLPFRLRERSHPPNSSRRLSHIAGRHVYPHTAASAAVAARG